MRLPPFPPFLAFGLCACARHSINGFHCTRTVCIVILYWIINDTIQELWSLLFESFCILLVVTSKKAIDSGLITFILFRFPCDFSNSSGAIVILTMPIYRPLLSSAKIFSNFSFFATRTAAISNQVSVTITFTVIDTGIKKNPWIWR